MKHFVKNCRDIYNKIISELLNRIEEADNIKPIVKRKISLRIEDTRKLFKYYNDGDVISYISQIRTIEEGIYQLLAIQIDGEYEKQYIKIKPIIKRNEDAKSFLIEKSVLDNSDNMIRNEYNYFCKYIHAGEMHDLVLLMSKNNKSKRVLNDFLSCCISIISINLIEALCYLLNIDNINISNMTCVSHIFYCILFMNDNVELFKKYEANLEYNFEEANEQMIGELSKIMLKNIDESKELKNMISTDDINELNKKINNEIKEYSIKKSDFEYVMKNVISVSKNLKKNNCTSEEALKEKLNTYIANSERYKNITYPHK